MDHIAILGYNLNLEKILNSPGKIIPVSFGPEEARYYQNKISQNDTLYFKERGEEFLLAKAPITLVLQRDLYHHKEFLKSLNEKTNLSMEGYSLIKKIDENKFYCSLVHIGQASKLPSNRYIDTKRYEYNKGRAREWIIFENIMPLIKNSKPKPQRRPNNPFNPGYGGAF